MNSASAFCWASAPASVTGVMAPASVNGVATTGWPHVAISMSPSDIGPSRRSGEFVFTIVISVGSRTRVSRSTPLVMLRPRWRRRRPSGPTPRQCHDLSSRVASVRYMSRWRVSTGRSVGSSGPPALLVDDVERADEPDVVQEVGVVAGAPAAIEIGDERGTADRAEHEVSATELDARRGFRACRVNGDGASATSSSTRAGSSRTVRVPAVDRAPSAAKRSSAAAPSTSSPISGRILSEARWIASTWSADRISTGRNGLTMRRQGERSMAPTVRRGRRREPSAVTRRG